MKTQFYRLMFTCILCIGTVAAAFSQSFCIIDDFGEPYMLMATSTGPNCYSLTGTASITGGATEDWPVSGTFCNGFITITATNPNPDGCTSFVDAVNFRWHYTCGKNASTCAMEGGYQQVCFGGVIGEFTLGATVYKNSSACNSGIHAAHSAAAVSQNNSASSTQSFCIIDDFGEPYMLMATSTGPNCYSLTGTASITGGATEDWPVSG
ncbi:MAG: hypothetical protein H0W62_15235, partial [Chitinophagales bacterium]|nr:hypothetical protein [Chitinophagales bacterium]